MNYKIENKDGTMAQYIAMQKFNYILWIVQPRITFLDLIDGAFKSS